MERSLSVHTLTTPSGLETERGVKIYLIVQLHSLGHAFALCFISVQTSNKDWVWWWLWHLYLVCKLQSTFPLSAAARPPPLWINFALQKLRLESEMCSKSSCLLFLARLVVVIKMSSIGDYKVLFSSLQDFLVCGPHLNLFDVIFYFSETLTQLIKPMQWGVPDPLYANRITRRTERWEKKAQSSDFLGVRYINIWWTKVNLNRVMEAINVVDHQ